MFSVSDACHPYEPFKCPGDGNCISIQYLCDGAPDCSDGYDEDMRLCTAGELIDHTQISLNFNLPYCELRNTEFKRCHHKKSYKTYNFIVTV